MATETQRHRDVSGPDPGILCVSVSLWLMLSVFSRPLCVDHDLPESHSEAVGILGLARLRAAAAARRRGRRRHDASGNLPARARPGALERRLRAAVAAAG